MKLDVFWDEWFLFILRKSPVYPNIFMRILASDIYFLILDKFYFKDVEHIIVMNEKFSHILRRRFLIITFDLLLLSFIQIFRFCFTRIFIIRILDLIIWSEQKHDVWHLGYCNCSFLIVRCWETANDILYAAVVKTLKGEITIFILY